VETLTETLLQRVENLIEAHKSDEPLLSTTPVPVVLGELAARCQGFEQALREIAAEVEKLASREG
jgi:hypothetical protein